jgi:two-component system chemotaxis sensor kinase CheA
VLGEVNRSVEELSRCPAELSACADTVSGRISGVVSAIQSYDITRQQTEHVREALAEIAVTMKASGDEVLPGNTTAALRVQLCQLENIHAAMAAWTTRIDECLESIGTVSQARLERVAPMVLVQEELLSGRLRQIEAIERESAIDNSEAAEALSDLSGLVALAGEHAGIARTTRDRLQVLSFNSIIEARNLGSKADVMLEISRNVARIASDWGVMAEKSGEIRAELQQKMNETHGAIDSLKQEREQAAPNACSEIDSALGDLRTAARCSAGYAAEMAPWTAGLHEHIEAARAISRSIRDMTAEIARSTEQVGEFRQSLMDAGCEGECDLAMLEEQYSRAYTTEIERTIMRSALYGQQEPAEAKAAPKTEANFGALPEWRIRFAPGPDMLRNGSDPLLLIKELAGLGKLKVEASLVAVPPFAELEPQRCYVSWDMTLSTASGADAIRDVFIFVQDNCELSVEPVSPRACEPEPAAPALCAADMTAAALAKERNPQGGRRAYDKPDSAASLRVPAVKLDVLVDLVGELVTVQARLSQLAAERDDAEVSSVAEEVERLASALRENSMNMRMLPIRSTFERFRRLVHDLARDLGKNVELTIEGADTELDKTVIEQLGDPLMHLIRNSMDHGIEAPDARTAQGKRATARIHLAARHAGASVLISVSDDSRGIDSEAVRKRAVERGLTSQDASLTEAEIFEFIFEPGFSTARAVSDVSGRGVGMDVVRKSVDMLRGSIEVASQRGSGTTVTLRLPLTLAIIDGLLVTVAQASFVLPLANTLECIELKESDAEESGGKHIVSVRGEIVPYIRLREYLNLPAARPAIEQIMLVETEGPLRAGGGPGAGQLPDGHQVIGPLFSRRADCFRRHDPRQWHGGPHSRRAAAGAGSHPGHNPELPRAVAHAAARHPTPGSAQARESLA